MTRMMIGRTRMFILSEGSISVNFPIRWKKNSLAELIDSDKKLEGYRWSIAYITLIDIPAYVYIIGSTHIL